MAAIRNWCVARGQIPAGPNQNVYTVPANYAFIMKFVGLQNPGAGTSEYYLVLNASTGAAAINIALGSLADYAIAPWDGWTVLNEGDWVGLGSSVTPLNYWIAGALLPFVPGL